MLQLLTTSADVIMCVMLPFVIRLMRKNLRIPSASKGGLDDE
jgi:hypothetical protein